MRATHICGERSEAVEPSSAHYSWHYRWNTEPCGKALEEHAWRSAEKTAGRPLSDYQPVRPNRYVCGSAEDVEEPSRAHEKWHLRNPEERGRPCEKSVVEAAWYRWVRKTGRPAEEWWRRENRTNWNNQKVRVFHECGEASDATGPSQSHYAWDKKHYGKPCGLAREEYSWYEAERRAGHPIEDLTAWRTRERTSRKGIPLVSYECGEAVEATEPNVAHYAWHLYNGTECCPRSRKEFAWSKAQDREERVIKDFDWQPKNMGGYECGTAEDAERPTSSHYSYDMTHYGKACDKAKVEGAWAAKERSLGRPVPDYEPYSDLDWDAPTSVYQYTFLDGDRYYGITSRRPEVRWQHQTRENSRLGEKIRSGVPYTTEVLCVAPDRRQAVEIERLAIKSGNPWGNLLNDQHNPDNKPAEASQ